MEFPQRERILSPDPSLVRIRRRLGIHKTKTPLPGCFCFVAPKSKFLQTPKDNKLTTGQAASKNITPIYPVARWKRWYGALTAPVIF